MKLSLYGILTHVEDQTIKLNNFVYMTKIEIKKNILYFRYCDIEEGRDNHNHKLQFWKFIINKNHQKYCYNL